MVGSAIPMLAGMDDCSLITAYLLVLLLPAALGIIAGASRREWGSKLSNILCGVSCLAGVVCYLVWYLVPDFTATFPLGSMLGDYSIKVDELTAIFVTFSSAVFLMVVTHMSHSGHGYRPGYMGLTCALFLSCVLCMMADTVILLLIAWEIVSMVTFLMGETDEDTPRWRFFAITHVGGLILMGVYAYLWIVSGTTVMSDWTGLASVMGHTTTSVVVFLLFIAFGTKLGTVPFHAWMPDMYAKSPTHTTALLTTVCSNAAVLMLFKAVFSYIGMGEHLITVGIVLCILSAMTALWGAMESMIQTEPKRILSYSSMENMALVTMCLSLAMIFAGDLPNLQALVLIAALLHTLNHGVFKSLMMLTVDSIEDVTGERKIDRFGGIACVLPALSAVALIGVMSLAAIPPMNGFVSEWLMLQTLLGTDAVDSTMRVAMPLLVAMMGVCGMIVATSYARLYGFIFLGRPRSEGAAKPRPMRKGSILPLICLAAMCVGMGILSIPLMDSMNSGISYLLGSDMAYRDGMSGTLMPLTMGILLAGCVLVIFLMLRVTHKKTEIYETWGCGGTLDERMQYSSEGFSQPIVRVFHPIYQDVSEKKGDKYSTLFVEPFVKYIYRPFGHVITYVSQQVTRLQTGNIQSYLGYILVTLVVALLAVRLL